MYSIERDRAKNRIVVIVAEYDYEPSQLIADMQEAISDVKSSGGEFDILSDWSAASVMPQDHAQDSEGMSAWLINNGLRRSANVMTSVV